MQLSTLSPLSPLASILIDIERAIEAKLYYPALLVALTIPDICTALTLDKSVFVKEKHYVAFVDKYTTPRTLGMSGQDCYRMRGGIVHRAHGAGHDRFGWSHVIFTLPESGMGVHAITLKVSPERNAAALDLKCFCGAMITAAHKWYEDHKTDAKVIGNMDNLIRYCPKGLSPFLGGAPIVASGE